MDAEPFTYLNESTGLFELIGDEHGSHDDQILDKPKHIAKSSAIWEEIWESRGKSNKRKTMQSPCRSEIKK